VGIEYVAGNLLHIEFLPGKYRKAVSRPVFRIEHILSLCCTLRIWPQLCVRFLANTDSWNVMGLQNSELWGRYSEYWYDPAGFWQCFCTA